MSDYDSALRSFLKSEHTDQRVRTITLLCEAVVLRVHMNDEIRIEVGLVNHLAYLGCVSFDSIIVWSSTHYNDEPCFKLAVSEPATIREAIEMLNI